MDEKLSRFEQMADAELADVNGGTFFGFDPMFIIGYGGVAWGNMRKHNPGMPVSAVNA